MKRIGIFAGTFDPVHKGHLEFCIAAARRGNLEKVYLLPERHPRTKHTVTNLSDRVLKIRAAIQTPVLDVLELEDDHFSIKKTLPELQAQFDPAQLVLLMGSDVACGSLPHWPDLGTLLQTTEIIIGVRTSGSRDVVETTLQQLQAVAPFTYTIIDSPHPHISSSQLRD